ncbi:hypothetical protein EVAR_28157_1 [Eumeta japonica]|uniref:Uncharacterized protein n=1 Tax=Eumeta variegata TaxID=151549 RepID=A0A4C1VDD3_EUMVA|nr:hypothetical protein EVAR_28157_1 [Eumeta japonica]
MLKLSLNFTHPPVRARLDKHMGKSLVSLTDKVYMNELEERIRQVLEESLNRRVAARVLDEMERLKKLILVGKTPLEDCPPELYKHPVFVFWRLVNKEVEKESKKRADAYLRKLKVKRKMDQPPAESMEDVTEEEKKAVVVDVLKKCRMELIKRQGEDIHNGFRCTNSEFESQRYESNDVKNLKKLKTVDELYGLADKIIGTKRLQQS